MYAFTPKSVDVLLKPPLILDSSTYQSSSIVEVDGATHGYGTSDVSGKGTDIAGPNGTGRSAILFK